MIYGKGINDMYKKWAAENERNKKVYKKWHNMLTRCYSEKFHKKNPTYINCTVCERWLLLSNFVEDYKLIDGYDEEKFLNNQLALDKDIKSNGINKEYSLENCMWVSIAENTKQAMKTRDYSFMQGENNPMYRRTDENHPRSIKIVQYDKQGNLIKVWNSSYEIQRKTGINQGNIISCCKFWEMNCNKEEWFKKHKNRPYKTAGGFIFKYAIEE